MDIKQYEGRREVRYHGDSRFPCNIYPCSIPQDFRVVPVHWHEEMELISIKKGEGIVILDLKPYPVKAGDLVVVYPGRLHGIKQKAGAQMEYENIIFRLEMLIPAMPDRCSLDFLMPLLSENGPDSYLCTEGSPEHEAVLHQINLLDQISHERPYGYELAVKGIFYQLLFLFQRELPQEEKTGRQGRLQEKVKLVLKEVENRYAEPLSIKEMAERCGYSPSHFMKFFKEQMGTSFVEYLTDYRLLMAARLLLGGEESVTEIARITGFDQPSYFDRCFKRKYGMTPGQYRKEGGGE
ncbi:MAG TPA: AraC family transcriptional regulator [Candidatus Cottocaccamicrobium excrementipullorum]|nr:AraC family transcriptional regulator [Candidatus Cottocaccamicrobium excrementipullorum]